MCEYASYCQLLRSYRPLLWCCCGGETLASLRGRGRRRFYHNLFTTCSVKEGGGFTLFIPHCLCITQHTNTDHWGVPAQSAELMQHPPPRFFLKAERTVARPELWLHTPASCLAAHAQWAPRGAQCVCRVASVWPELFLIRPRLESVMASLWHVVVNLTLNLPNLCFLCIPANFCNIQPTACKKTWVSELKLPSHPHLQKSENSSRNRVLYRNLRCLWASKPNLNGTSIFRSLQVHFQTVMRFIAVNIGR